MSLMMEKCYLHCNHYVLSLLTNEIGVFTDKDTDMSVNRVYAQPCYTIHNTQFCVTGKKGVCASIYILRHSGVALYMR